MSTLGREARLEAVNYEHSWVEAKLEAVNYEHSWVERPGWRL